MEPKEIFLNTARNAFRCIIRAYGIEKIHLPYYTCPSIWQIAHKENCKIEFYHIDKNFFPTKEFSKEDYILYTNYFGVCGKNVKKLAEKYPNLIVDNAHACFAEKIGLASFCSLRKFFPVADGAILYLQKEIETLPPADASSFAQTIASRNDFSNRETYDEFVKNETRIETEAPALIAENTLQTFNSIDKNQAKTKRIENFKTLQSQLKDLNKLKLELCETDVPMCYPYLPKNEKSALLLREKFSKENIFIEQYWGKMPVSSREGVFQKYLLPLPIGQNHGQKEMKKLIEIIK